MMLRDQSRILISCNLVLVCLIMVTLFFCVRQWQLDWQITHRELPIVNINAINQEIGLNELSNLHVFGESPTENVPITSLDFRLTGIAKHSSLTKPSKAYISYSNQPSKIFAVGETISHGIRLYEVLEDSIVVENNSRLEKLPLSRQRLEFKSRSLKE